MFSTHFNDFLKTFFQDSPVVKVAGNPPQRLTEGSPVIFYVVFLSWVSRSQTLAHGMPAEIWEWFQKAFAAHGLRFGDVI